MTASYPMGECSGDVVASGAMLRVLTVSRETARRAVCSPHHPGNLTGTDSAVESSRS